MVSISNRAAEKLKDELIHRCSEKGVGFRVLANAGESGKAPFGIKLDRQHQGDKVIDSGGVRLFIDPSSAARIRKHQLDYNDEPSGGFFLTRTQEGNNQQNPLGS